MSEIKQRLLLIDVFRIVAILLIVVFHLAQFYNDMFIHLLRPFGPIYLNIAWIGLIMFVIVSGMGLEYSSRKIKDWSMLISFYKRRFCRIYPTYWMSIILLLIINPVSPTLQNFIYQAIALFNFGVFVPTIYINYHAWFIGLILFFYLLFPAISYLLDKYGYLCISIFFLISFSVAWYYNNYSGMRGAAWHSLLCYLAYFALGVFLIKRNMYPKISHNSHVLILMADLSFPVFLIHGGLLHLWSQNPVLFIIEVIGLSFLLLLFDRWINFNLSILNSLIGNCLSILKKTTNLIINNFNEIIAIEIIIIIIFLIS